MTAENTPAPEDDLPEQLRIRREKRANLIERGIEPYPVAVARTKSLKEIRDKYVNLEVDIATGDTESLTGRIIFKRDTGKLCFATLREGDGTELQAMLSLDKVGQDSLDAWKSDIDLGDIVSVTGEIITSKRGELSILATSWALASKSLRPLPNDHKPMSEETRVRMRYVDLIVRPEARSAARMRPTVMRSLRDTFNNKEFIEVETPMLQVMHGGAAARPFKTLATPMTWICICASRQNSSLRDAWSVVSNEYLRSTVTSVMKALIHHTHQSLQWLSHIWPMAIGVRLPMSLVHSFKTLRWRLQVHML
jgi:lysyl-tRNA synthetase, class II